MKKLFPLMFLFVFILASCEKDEPATPVVEIENQIVFWSDFPGEPITVTVEGSNIGTITAISSTSPGCGSSGNITRTYAPGTYSFTARESGPDPIT